tara:strand:- start:7224 stop:9482 length:2259 start_codon:yes stop_codon:yes gene_type:complete
MKKLIALFLSISLISCQNDELKSSENKGSTKFHPKVEEIVSQMSIAEKAGQMTQLNIDVLMQGEVFNLSEPHRFDPEKLKKAIVDYKVGSILNVGGHAYSLKKWHEIINGIDEAAQKTSLKVPVLYGIDAIHGANYTLGSTLFPQQLAQAATWNPSLVKRGAEITAYEVRASGIAWNFSPVLDLARQPLWSRFFETYGEDVYLAKQMTKAAIKGYEGDSIIDPYHVASCMKHFLAYSMPFSGKDRTPVYLAERQLRELFLPSFEEAIKTGAKTVMINSGEINGIPVHANRKILTELLRNELGFKGLAVTDWEDIIKLHSLHKVAPSLKEAVKMAINAGIDMSMVPNDYEFTDLLIELIEENEIPMSRIDEAVSRILQLKLDLGLFENAAAPDLKDYPLFGSDEFAETAYNTAIESISLLKNENNLLPLNKDQKIFLTGPGADEYTLLNGAWTRTWQGSDKSFDEEDKATILEAMQASGAKVDFELGCAISNIENIELAMSKAKKSDIIVVCIAEEPSTEKPGDINSLDLDKAQLEYVQTLQKLNKPMVLVMLLNRPRIVNQIVDNSQSILMAYQPGSEGGRAINDLIFGIHNPSGKLPFTYPRYGSTLLSYDHKTTERLDTEFGMNAFNPQWEFGFGLSYTEFEYSDFKISSDSLDDKGLKVSITISNKGEREGKEVVQLYVSDDYASITPPVKRLRKFSKISLKAKESKQVEFWLYPQDLAFIGNDLKWITEPGSFSLEIANQKKTIVYAP